MWNVECEICFHLHNDSEGLVEKTLNLQTEFPDENTNLSFKIMIIIYEIKLTF